MNPPFTRWAALGGVAVIALLAVAVASGRPGKGADAISEVEISLFKTEGARWIRAERDRHRPHGRSLSASERQLYAAYFSAEVLDRARVRTLERFENPEFFSVFDRAGLPRPMDLRRASGLALLDTILIARRADVAGFRDRLLFHELVHLTQYQLLGLEGYMERYVDGWAEGGRTYRTIPQERQAFELAQRFVESSEPFSVDEAVRLEFGL